MEPASTLAVVALAAATIVPHSQIPKPNITIILKNWVNKNGYPINIYPIAEDDYDFKSPIIKKPIAQIIPGDTYDINTSIDLVQGTKDAVVTALRFRANRDNPLCCADMVFVYCQNRQYGHLSIPFLEISFNIRVNWPFGHSLTLFHRHFDCRDESEAKHYLFEIDGNILGYDMRYSHIDVKKIVLTKIK